MYAPGCCVAGHWLLPLHSSPGSQYTGPYLQNLQIYFNSCLPCIGNSHAAHYTQGDSFEEIAEDSLDSGGRVASGAVSVSRIVSMVIQIAISACGADIATIRVSTLRNIVDTGRRAQVST